MMKNNSGSEASLPRFAFLGDYLSHWAAVFPDQEAAVLNDERLAYSDLKSKVDRAAKGLLSLGIKKGDRVAVLQVPCIDFLVMFLAIQEVGAIWLGINPKFQKQEIDYFIDNSEPTVVFVRRAVGDRCFDDVISSMPVPLILFDDSDVPSGMMSMASFLKSGEDVSDSWLDQVRSNRRPKDPCAIVYTSGSTGRPKGALLHHDGLSSFAVRQNELWPINPLRIINYFPVNHIGCLIDVTAFTLVAGGCQVFMEDFIAENSLSLIEEEKITFWATVPSVFSLQLSLPNYHEIDYSSLQLIVWEGASISEELLDKLMEFNVPMATNYGMTETSSAITATPPSRDKDLLLNSVGYAFPDSDVRLQPVDVSYEIQVQSSSNFLGYWRNEEASKQAFTDDGYFRTGDLAEQQADGRYQIVGRLKEMFKSGGYNVYPKEIEAVLEGLPSVDAAVVVSIPDPVWSEVGFAFLTAESGANTTHIKEACRAELANYKIPKYFRIVDEFPLLPIGKVDRKSLKELALKLTTKEKL